MKLATTCLLLALTTSANAFSVNHSVRQQSTQLQQQQSNVNGNDDESSSRRNFLSQSMLIASSTLVGSSTGMFFNPLPASAAVSGITKVNAKLKGFGLPPVASVPDGFQPLLEIYGKGKNRTPLLVTFNHPLSWVVTLPSQSVNGEDGTVQAGDYGKGDTATLFVYNDPGNVGDITKTSKELLENALKRSIGQKGDNMYQNFKITKVEPGTGSYYGDQKYVTVDFKYQLLTGAGFEVDRKGVASITSEGKAVQVLWAASTSARYKKTEPILRDIVSSFRCYAEGLNFSDELYKAPDEF